MVNNPLLKPLQIGDRSYDTRYTRKFERRKPWTAPDPSVVRCVIPGVIRDIYVAPGQTVERNASLMVLEAMKMQNDIRASTGGVVKTVFVRPGQMVAKGDPLIEIEIETTSQEP
jgi:biotin carboxyl carrier protein